MKVYVVLSLHTNMDWVRQKYSQPNTRLEKRWKAKV